LGDTIDRLARIKGKYKEEMITHKERIKQMKKGDLPKLRIDSMILHFQDNLRRII